MRFGLVVLLFCGTALAGDWRTMLSPGPMAPAHESLGGNCDACHLSFAGVPDAKCLDCHEGLAARIPEGGDPPGGLEDHRPPAHGGGASTSGRTDARGRPAYVASSSGA